MNAPEGLDIRAPIGGLFTVLGAMLAGYGLFTSGSRGSSDLSSGANVNPRDSSNGSGTTFAPTTRAIDS